MLAKKLLGAAAAAEPLYIEDVFSTYLYTGNGSTQTITNGIDLAGEGGLVWIKQRTISTGTGYHFLYDSARGFGAGDPANGYAFLSSNTTSAQGINSNTLLSFNSNGFSLDSDIGGWGPNRSGSNIASWTFRKAEKFFDVVTYTGNGTAGRTVAHNLGSVPGVIFVKNTSNGTRPWAVYHRSLGGTQRLILNTTDAAAAQTSIWNDTAPTSTVFTVGDNLNTNGNGDTYVAYLFAHNAGGFGDDGNQNVISCGSFTTDSGGFAPVVELGYEPQWVLLKPSGSTGAWLIVDTMRGWVNNGTAADDANLRPNVSDAENLNEIGYPTATGFYSGYRGAANTQWIYIAIRRGPMKTPEVGTEVFTTNTYTGTGAARTITTGFVTDLVLGHGRTNDPSGTAVADRLRGDTRYLQTAATFAEATSDGASQDITGFDLQTGYTLGVPNNSWMNNNGSPGVNWAFRRAPGFFDVVCYTGAGTTLTVNHNLGVVPEMMIMKRRNTTGNWSVYTATTGVNKVIELNEAYGAQTASYWGTGPTTTTFQVQSNVNSGNFVAYLFASCPGVSKVGSYTGTGTTQQIDCGFSSGARFVLIKRTDDNSSGTANWYVWDSARGIVAGNDPYLLLNSTAAEVTNTDYVDTYSAGFEISSTAPAAINANGGSFIFLAIA